MRKTIKRKNRKTRRTIKKNIKNVRQHRVYRVKNTKRTKHMKKLKTQRRETDRIKWQRAGGLDAEGRLVTGAQRSPSSQRSLIKLLLPSHNTNKYPKEIWASRPIEYIKREIGPRTPEATLLNEILISDKKTSGFWRIYNIINNLHQLSEFSSEQIKEYKRKYNTLILRFKDLEPLKPYKVFKRCSEKRDECPDTGECNNFFVYNDNTATGYMCRNPPPCNLYSKRHRPIFLKSLTTSEQLKKNADHLQSCWDKDYPWWNLENVLQNKQIPEENNTNLPNASYFTCI